MKTVAGSFAGDNDCDYRSIGRKYSFFCPRIYNDPEAYDTASTNEPDAAQDNEKFKDHIGQ
jgi:hypothetical protein